MIFLFAAIQFGAELLLLGIVWTGVWFLAAMTGHVDGGNFSGALAVGVSLTLLILGFSVGVALWSHQQVMRLGPRSHAGDPPRSERYDAIERQQRGNTIVYSGYRPFVGAGEVIDTWGFAIRLAPARSGTSAEPAREFASSPFATEQLIATTGQRTRTLAFDPTAEGHIPGLSVLDRVFLAGTEANGLSTYTDPVQVMQVIRNPTSRTPLP